MPTAIRNLCSIWLDRAPGRTQVVSTTPALLFPRVQAGAFIDRLYYRLNTVCMDVTGRDHFTMCAQLFSFSRQ